MCRVPQPGCHVSSQRQLFLKACCQAVGGAENFHCPLLAPHSTLSSTLLPALKLNSPPALPLAPQPQPDDFDYSAKPPAAAEFENVTLWEAWAIPGVASFALCLFFSKLIAYTFL